MKFSVAIPAYKPQFLKEAIESVQAQSFTDWELIIVDDCSPADLRSIVAPFLLDSRISHYRNEKNFGAIDVVDNWNRCLEYCTGDYVICMGDDDRLLPNCLEDLAGLIDHYPGLGVYHIQTEIIDETGRIIQVLKKRPEHESALDMMWHRWHDHWPQFIGDFCYSLPLLRKQGGYYKLPLAWCADDISAYRAACGGFGFPDGVANTQRPGFQYRQSALTLSSSDNTDVMAGAMVQACSWFMQRPDTELDDVHRRCCRSFYIEGIRDIVKSDIGRHPRRLYHWLSHRKMCNLSLLDIFYQSAKGLSRRALGLLEP